MRHSIKTIQVVARQWFDRANGNGYFSAQVYINHGLGGERTLYLPFQYGYGSFYEDESFKAIKEQVNKSILKHTHKYSLYTFCREHGITYLCSKHENCLKRDVIAWGVCNEN